MRTEDRRVQRLVPVRLGLSDVVLDPLLKRRESLVDHAQGVVTVGHRIHQHANRQQIVDLLVRLVPLLHLLVDRPEVLRPPGDLDVHDAGIAEQNLQRITQCGDGSLTLGPPLRDELRQRLVLRRLDVLEREVLELPSHPRHSKPVGERRVKIAGFLRDAAPLVRREEIQGAHVVQAVCELDQNHSRVLRDRQQQLAVVLDLSVLRRVEREMADLRQAVDYFGDLLSELALDLLDADGGVLDDVVNESAGDSYRVELEVGQNLGDFDAMRDEILARETLLSKVRGFAEPIGAQKQLLIETLGKRLAVIVPSGNDGLGFDRRHNSPASAKLR